MITERDDLRKIVMQLADVAKDVDDGLIVWSMGGASQSPALEFLRSLSSQDGANVIASYVTAIADAVALDSGSRFGDLVARAGLVLSARFIADDMRFDLDACVDEIRSTLAKSRRFICLDETLDCLGTVCDQKTKARVAVAVELAGMTGIIDVKLDPMTCDDVIELIIGSRFAFARVNARQQRLRASRARFAVIDGFVESCDEIVGLLSHSTSCQEPLFIVARGFSRAVDRHAIESLSNQVSDIVLCAIGSDVSHVNTLKDVAVCVGCDVVSSLKGELISCIDYGSLPIVDDVIVDGNTVIVNNDVTRAPVDAHLRTLRRMLVTPNISSAVRAYVLSRIASLSTRKVEITLASGAFISTDSFDSVDRALKFVRTALSSGVVDVENASDVGTVHVHAIIDLFRKRCSRLKIDTLSYGQAASICCAIARIAHDVSDAACLVSSV